MPKWSGFFFFFSAHSGAHNAKAEVKIWRFQTRGFHGTLVIRLFGRLTARFCLDVSRCQAVLWSAPVSLSLLLSSVFTVRGLQRARKGPRLARTEGAYVGQSWFPPPLHHLDHSFRPCPDQPAAVTRPARRKPGKKTPLVTASTESWWDNSQQDRTVWEVSWGAGWTYDTLYRHQSRSERLGQWDEGREQRLPMVTLKDRFAVFQVCLQKQYNTLKQVLIFHTGN